MLLALPVGELSKPEALTERAYAVALSAEVSSAIRSFPAATEAVPLRADFPRPGEDVA